MNFRHKRMTLSCIVAMFIFAGCVSTANIRRDINLSPGSYNGATVSFIGFDDARSFASRKIMGGLFNGFDSRTGDLMAPDNLVDDLEILFVKQLRAAGYKLAADKQAIVISGSIESIGCDVAVQSKADVRIKFVVDDRGENVLTAVYSGNDEGASMYNTTCADQLTNSVLEAARHFTDELSDYMISN
ncbi:MAG: 2,3-bisphosphoglycerate-independent phosphoglycerate mutase [Candidatus Omnitrophota bacterium]|jgi:2,3-bisphosphoglycerate-independent phosphoglycerate mutase